MGRKDRYRNQNSFRIIDYSRALKNEDVETKNRGGTMDTGTRTVISVVNGVSQPMVTSSKNGMAATMLKSRRFKKQN